MLRLLLVVSVVCGKTVRYTNVRPYTSGTKSYSLHVPGSKPIRIFEAIPDWDKAPAAQAHYPGLEHRSISINSGDSVTEDEPGRSTVYSPVALNAFLREYAEKIRQEKRNASETLRSDKDGAQDVSKSWADERARPDNPYDDKNGWVSLEAIPWSTSKISKWQSNHKYQSKPWDDEQRRPIEWDNRPHHPDDRYKKPSYNYDKDTRPSYSRPNVHSYTPRPHYSEHSEYEWATDTTHRKRPQNNRWDRPSHSEKKPALGNRDEMIITDGLPSDFPKPPEHPRPYEPLQARPESVVHRPSHPDSGDGEWVLVSTTRGYQYPKNKYQRSVDVSPDSIGVKRSIRLTVLPPENGTNVNMTTSHGGLLEVDSTFETVEDSQRMFAEQMNLNSTASVTEEPETQSPQLMQLHHASVLKPKPNTNDVLAAVGAGMVPATIAMLMPFVGRKRRSLENSIMDKAENLL